MPTKWSSAFTKASDSTYDLIYGNLQSKNLEDGPGTDRDKLQLERYRAGLATPAPNQWFSPHLVESGRLSGAVYVAITVLAKQAAAAKPRVYRWHPDARMSDDTEAREALPRGHQLSRLLLHPNRHDSWGALQYRNVQQLSLTGTFLNWRVDSGLNRPVELWNIPTSFYQPVPVSELWPDGAYRVLPYYPSPLNMLPSAWTVGGVTIDAGSMIAVRHPHPLVQTGEGLSPLSACSLSLDTLQGIDQARFSVMRRQIQPSVVAELDPTCNNPTPQEIDRISAQLFGLYAGPNNAGKALIPPPGVKVTPWPVEGEPEVGWIESWGQLIGLVLSIFGLNQSVAMMSTEMTYAALYASLKQFRLLTLTPLLDMIADGYNRQLVWPYFGEDYVLELEPPRIDDEQITEAQIANDLKAGVRMVNEVRVLRGLKPTDEPWGEERAFAGKPAAAPAAEGDGKDGSPHQPENEAAQGLNGQRHDRREMRAKNRLHDALMNGRHHA